MKQQFSSLDIKVLSHELSQSLSGLRVQNVYDLSSRIFLFKFQKPEHREQLIVDPGFRCHLTSFVRTTAAEPSAFVRKVRKYIGTRRVTLVSQLGTDRIIEFQFSDGLFRMFLEFYAAGNIVITDKEYNVLTLLRNVNEASEADQLRIGSKYNISAIKNPDGVPEVTLDRIKLGLEAVVVRSEAAQSESQATSANAKKKQNATLRRALAGSISEYPLSLVDHVLKVHQIDATAPPKAVLDNETQLNEVLAALEDARRIVAEITQTETKGYIFAKRRADSVKSTKEMEQSEQHDIDAEENLIFEEFQPFKPKQFEDDSKLVCLETDGFNKTVDRYFSSIEGQRLDLRLHERELNAKKKLEDARRQHEQRLGSLEQTQTINVRKAEAIQANIERVQEATAAVNGLIAQGMDWVDIANLIEVEQSRGNPVAQQVKLPLKLQENTITLLLGEPETQDDGSEDTQSRDGSMESDSDDGLAPWSARQTQASTSDKKLAIDVDLSLSPWANASQYYDQKKVAADKQERTAAASTVALKNAQKRIEADLKKGLSKEKDILRPLRQAHWFEKFYFFISSDGYLVLAGKDPSQNDMIYSQSFAKGDVFVHANIDGASSVFIKNNPNTPDAPVPPSTLSQAGVLAVATSSAWDSKAVMAAYWVPFEQVTKVNANGDFLQPGDFNISGEKNFLPPAQLLVGVALTFEITEESKASHNKHRVLEPVESATNEVQSMNLGESENGSNATEAGEQNNTEDSDSDEDFPDAVPQAKYDSDDEDFPDTELQAQSASDSEADVSAPNPLQTSSIQGRANSGSVADESVAIPVADSESVAASAVTESMQTSRRHMSAKERRLLKKGIQPVSNTAGAANGASMKATENNNDASDSDTESVATTATATTRGGGSSSTLLPRGKRTKLKKAAAKYAEQDEDDRAAAMAKLGSRAGSDRKADEVAARVLREQEEARQKQRRREQHLLKQAVARAQEAARHAAADSDGLVGDEAQPDAATVVDMSVTSRLVGKLVPGDQVVSVIAVCAPWPALASYKYKVKLQPGALKKGKAAREILGKWQTDAKVPRNIDSKSEDVERIWPREAELIAGLKDTEVIAVVPVGKVRVMMSGGAAGNASGKGKGSKGGGSARGGRGKKK